MILRSILAAFLVSACAFAEGVEVRNDIDFARPNGEPLLVDAHIPPGNPLEVQTSTVSAGQGFNLTCSVTNKSNQEIVAYAIVADFFDSSGKPAGRLSSNAIMNLATSSKDSTRGLAPGASGGSNRTFSLPSESDGTPVRFKVFVDYVLFKDGSTWGPDTTKQSLKIMGTQEGWRISRSELKRLLSERGIQAVVDALAE